MGKRIYEDLPITYQLMFECDKVAFCNRFIYFYRLRKDSIEGSQFLPKKMDSALKIVDAMNEYIDLLNRVKKAFICRMFSFSFHLLLAMSDDYEKKAQLYKLIRDNRFEVLTDRRARRKARYAALISYLGEKCTKSIFSRINKRK